jgi:hypothetical protein
MIISNIANSVIILLPRIINIAATTTHTCKYIIVIVKTHTTTLTQHMLDLKMILGTTILS